MATATSALHTGSLRLPVLVRGGTAGTSSGALLQPSRSCSIAGPPVVSVRPLVSTRPQRRSRLEVVAAATEAKPAAEADWKVKRDKLVNNKVRSVPPKTALQLQEDGYTFFDVRTPPDHDEVHPRGSTNVPVYRLIKEWTAWDILRRAGFAFFGIFNGTELNPEFIKEVNGAVPDKKAGIIVACLMGGTTKPSQNFPEGKESRSLIAAYLLSLDGYTNIVHVEGGLQRWFSERLPVNFKDDDGTEGSD